MEFMEYRQYTPGDDLKHIDWKRYAKTDRLFVKEFEEETNTTCHLLLDISNSMGYGSGKMTKLEYSSYLTATLAYLMIRQRDSVAISLFDEQIINQIPPKSTRGHLHSILLTLENTKLGSKTDLGKPFHEIAETIKKRGIVIIISDLFDDAESIIYGLKHLVFRGNEVILFHVLDPLEDKFNFKDVVELEDMETGDKMLIAGEVARKIYQKNSEEFKKKMQTECGMLGIDYNRFLTNQPLDFALLEYLAARA